MLGVPPQLLLEGPVPQAEEEEVLAVLALQMVQEALVALARNMTRRTEVAAEVAVEWFLARAAQAASTAAAAAV